MRLESKNAELERFTYTVSHDLKSPLSRSQAFLAISKRMRFQVIHKKIKGKSNDYPGRPPDAILLNDLLELSRIGRIINLPENIPFEEVLKESNRKRSWSTGSQTCPNQNPE